MLIKIAKAPYLEGFDNYSYAIYDNVESIELCRTKPIEINSNEGIQQSLVLKGLFSNPAPDIFIDILNIDRINDFIDIDNGVVGSPAKEKLSDNKVYLYNVIIFVKGGKRHYVTFDTIAYICNDEGKTLEKCFAGGILNK